MKSNMEETFNLVLQYEDCMGYERVEVYASHPRAVVKEILINTLSQPESYGDVKHSLSVASSNIHCSWGKLDTTFNTEKYNEDRADEEIVIIETLRDEINAEVEEIKKKDLLQQIEARKLQDAATKAQEEAKERELYYSLKQKYEHS